jgi:hypothetical protein
VMPPLVIPDALLHEGLDVIARSVEDTAPRRFEEAGSSAKAAAVPGKGAPLRRGDDVAVAGLAEG